jgi:hypothetical protein
LVISFLFVFIGATTAFGELLKLPVLIHHFSDHIQDEKNTDFSFFDFLAEHYTGDINHSDKHHDHSNLPFKTLNTHIAQVLTIVPQSIYHFPQVIAVRSKLKGVFHTQQNYSNTYLDSIWQPPRFS